MLTDNKGFNILKPFDVDLSKPSVIIIKKFFIGPLETVLENGVIIYGVLKVVGSLAVIIVEFLGI